MGRPSKYSKKLCDEILLRIASGETLRTICNSPDIPARKTICHWLLQKEEFRNQYTIARELQAELLAEEILEIADKATDTDFRSAKLQIDARKWFASKVAPKRFGERTTQDLNVTSTPKGTEIAIEQRLREILS